jgi:hypothetical protein
MTDVQQRDGASQEAVDRLIQGLGGRAAVERAAVQRSRATGLRHHQVDDAEFVGAGGVTILCAENSVPFFESVLRSDHTISPDRLQRNPVPVAVHGIKDEFTLPTARGGRLEAHKIATDHSADTRRAAGL